jgi:hypothetical protein
MYLRKICSAVAVVAALLLAATYTQAQATSTEPKLDGTFDAVLSSGNFHEKERYTFAAGQSTDDGSLIFSNEVDAIPPCTTDHGVWARTGPRTYTLTHGAFCSDFANNMFYTLKWREAITLGPRGNGFAGRGLVEIFDPSGMLLFSAPYTVRGTRMQAEAPPSSRSISAPSTPGEWFKAKRPVSNRNGAQF